MKKATILLILLLFTAACARIPSARDGASGGVLPGQTLPRGVSLTFLQNQPPSEVFTDFDFWIKLRVTNHGKNNVGGSIKVSDSAPDTFGGISGTEEKSFSLNGIEQTIDAKGNVRDLIESSEEITFGPYQYNDEVGKELKTTIRAELDYAYDLLINPQLCIKGRLVEGASPKCNENYILSGNELGFEASSAPISITRIEKNTLTGDENFANIRLNIFLRDSGGGRINNPDQVIEDINVELVGSGDFKCTPRIISFKKDKGEKSFVCLLSTIIGEEELVEAPLRVSLTYPYVAQIAKTITIKSSFQES